MSKRRWLVMERGLLDTRTNRRWLALVGLLTDYVSSQEQAEEMAWEVIKLWENTK